MDLGGRQIHILPTPGHHEDAITLYDSQTGWLLTGDILYPGLIYIKNWQAYRDSIRRLTVFADHHPVRAILGGHIEMTRQPGVYYPIGTTWQPDEARLELGSNSLQNLDAALQQHPEPATLRFAQFIVQPMNAWQRGLSNLFRWFQ